MNIIQLNKTAYISPKDEIITSMNYKWSERKGSKSIGGKMDHLKAQVQNLERETEFRIKRRGGEWLYDFTFILKQIQKRKRVKKNVKNLVTLT